MRPLHNFRSGPSQSDDHPVFNAAEERGVCLNAFREDHKNYAEFVLFAVLDVLSTTSQIIAPRRSSSPRVQESVFDMLNKRLI